MESRVEAAVASTLGLAKLLHISSAKRECKAVAVMVPAMTVSSKDACCLSSPICKAAPTGIGSGWKENTGAEGFSEQQLPLLHHVERHPSPHSHPHMQSQRQRVRALAGGETRVRVRRPGRTRVSLQARQRWSPLWATAARSLPQHGAWRRCSKARTRRGGAGTLRQPLSPQASDTCFSENFGSPRRSWFSHNFFFFFLKLCILK